MKKVLGILGLLVFICVVMSFASDRFLTAGNIENLLRRTALFGILGIGVSFVIITGGIDLSIGSMVGLVGCMLPFALAGVEGEASVGTVVLLVGGLLVGAAALGLGHGLLVTKVRLQPFVVTLCGLLIYRGCARGILGDETAGFGTRYAGLRAIATGEVPVPGLDGFAIPAPCFLLAAVATLAAIFLNKTVWGRYLFALGRNEEAARFSGIATGRIVVVAYVIGAFCSGLGGVLFIADVNSAQPSSLGSFYELYAIAAAVLGGCSLRGGEGSIVGVLIGTAVMQVLANGITLLGIPTQLEFAIIGTVILFGVAADELLRRLVPRRG